MTEPVDRAAIRARARARAVEMGYAVRPEQQPEPEPDFDSLPTLKPGALRALLSLGHLTPGQAAAARRLFAAAANETREDPAA